MSTSSESTEMGELPPTDPTVTPSPAVGNATATGSRRSSLQQAGVQAQASDPPSSAGASSHQSGAPATLSSGSSRDTRNLASVPSAEVQNLSLNPSTSGSNVHQPEAPARQPGNGGETRRQRKQHRSDNEEEPREVIQGGTEPSSLGPTTLPRCTTVLYSTILCLIPVQ
ncbi:hypothetical protein V3C99_015917 [Haemonchus contortus]